MGRAIARRQPSGSALLWEQRRREATQALAAQAAGAQRPVAQTDDPSPKAGEGGGEPGRAAQTLQGA